MLRKNNLSASGKKKGAKQQTSKTKVNRKQRRKTFPVFKGEKCSVRRRELWKTIQLTADTPLAGSYAFKAGNFPPWFDKISACYEHYKVNGMKLVLTSAFSGMTSGSAVLSFNTVFSDTITTDRGKMLAQIGAKEMKVSDHEVTVVIPKQALEATPSKKTCRYNGTGLDTSYAFDAVYLAVSSAAGPLYLYVDYDIDFYTPQLN